MNDKMGQAILCVGIEPSKLKFLDNLGDSNYIIVVNKTKAKEAGMIDDYFRNAFTYIESDPENFASVVKDVLTLLDRCDPPRTRIDLLVYSFVLRAKYLGLFFEYENISNQKLILMP
jgi:hypothetical protein